MFTLKPDTLSYFLYAHEIILPLSSETKFLEFETNKDQFVPILTSQPPRRCLHCSQISSRLSEIALFPNWPLLFFKHLQLERNSRRGLSQSFFFKRKGHPKKEFARCVVRNGYYNRARDTRFWTHFNHYWPMQKRKRLGSKLDTPFIKLKSLDRPSKEGLKGIINDSRYLLREIWSLLFRNYSCLFQEPRLD